MYAIETAEKTKKKPLSVGGQVHVNNKCQVWSAAEELPPLCLFEELQYLPKSTAQNLEAPNATPHLQSGLLLQIT